MNFQNQADTYKLILNTQFLNVLFEISLLASYTNNNQCDYVQSKNAVPSR